MIKQEILKIVRRRGLFGTALAVTIAVPIVVIVVDLILHGSRPESYSGGNDLLRGTFQGLLTLALVVFGVLIGAQAGAWEFANRTFRYLVMSGRPRLLLYSVRIPALLGVIAILIAPAALISLAGSALLPLEGAPAVDGTSVTDFLWELWLPTFVFAFISFTIGALLQSVGAAIAVALVTNFIGLSALSALSIVSEKLGDLMLPQLLDRLTGGDTTLSLAVAVIAMLVWLGALFAVGALRTVKSEY